MHERWLREVENGRGPDVIEFVHAAIPDEIDLQLREARTKGSREVTPG